MLEVGYRYSLGRIQASSRWNRPFDQGLHVELSKDIFDARGFQLVFFESSPQPYSSEQIVFTEFTLEI